MTLEHAEAALGTTALRYGRDEHYDVISAFIKSIRGSDPDAALHWLARMLEAGEDARFIARRLVILASEDVGMADPMGLVVADAAARAVEFVGLPEAQLNLAQAVVHLATRAEVEPRRVGVWQALRGRAQRLGGRGAAPPPRRPLPRQKRGSAHGEGYGYPHDDPRGWVAQQYLRRAARPQRYYEPSRPRLRGRDRGQAPERPTSGRRGPRRSPLDGGLATPPPSSSPSRRRSRSSS